MKKQPQLQLLTGEGDEAFKICAPHSRDIEHSFSAKLQRSRRQRAMLTAGGNLIRLDSSKVLEQTTGWLESEFLVLERYHCEAQLYLDNAPSVIVVLDHVNTKAFNANSVLDSDQRSRRLMPPQAKKALKMPTPTRDASGAKVGLSGCRVA
ncbi:hypothetical protein E4U40_007994 [Claviceps sp. LM458 group G5]|nr:hypothetical protein E4U40_007994 [Claviceps sp. LM458 group G5]